jgi:hypothetical protein
MLHDTIIEHNSWEQQQENRLLKKDSMILIYKKLMNTI